MPLTTEQIDSAQPGVTPDGRKTVKSYKMGDSGGLFLEVPPTGTKRWRLKYRFGRKEKRISLGLYPAVSLAEARENRDLFRAMLADGTDPSEHQKRKRSDQIAAEARQIAATRFVLGNDGALSLRLGKRLLTLTPAETTELRAFLDATRAVTPKE